MVSSECFLPTVDNHSSYILTFVIICLCMLTVLLQVEIDSTLSFHLLTCTNNTIVQIAKESIQYQKIVWNELKDLEGHSQRQNVLNRMIMQTAIKGNASKADPQGEQRGEVVVAIYHHQLRAECGKEKS